MPVTVLKLDGCQVVATRTKEKDGYTAVQLGSASPRPRMRARPIAATSRRPKSSPRKKLAEFRVDDGEPARCGRRIFTPIISCPARRST